MKLNDELLKNMQVVLNDINTYREEYIRAWIAETGLKPSECVIVEERKGTQIRMWVEKKK